MSDSDIDPVTAFYARKSRRHESEYPSCETQIDTCRLYALSQGWENCVAYVDDGKSGETLERDALKQMLESLRRGEVKRIVMTSLDRLTRKLAHLVKLLDELAQAEVVLAVVDFPEFNNSPTGRLMASIIGAANEFQIELTKERLADARAALKRQGKRVAGRVAFGYESDPNNKALTPHAEHAVVVRDFFKLASDGATPNELATLANLQGWPNQNGEAKRWTARQLIRILTNPTYTGRIHHGTSTLPGEHDAIVDQATFDAVQRQIESRKTRVSTPGERKENPRPKPLLRGILICGECNRPMSTAISHRGSIRYLYYRCRSTAGGRPPCPGVNVQCYEIDTLICGLLNQPTKDFSEPVRPIATAWGRLTEDAKRIVLPKILLQAVLQMSTGEITLALVDDAAEIVGKAAEQHTT